MTQSWELIKNSEVLGILTEKDINMPFVNCEFVAHPPFASYKAMFDKELRLLNSDQMDQWEKAYSDINELGLILEPNNSEAELITEFLLHIKGNEAWFRY